MNPPPTPQNSQPVSPNIDPIELQPNERDERDEVVFPDHDGGPMGDGDEVPE